MPAKEGPILQFTLPIPFLLAGLWGLVWLKAYLARSPEWVEVGPDGLRWRKQGKETTASWNDIHELYRHDQYVFHVGEQPSEWHRRARRTPPLSRRQPTRRRATPLLTTIEPRVTILLHMAAGEPARLTRWLGRRSGQRFRSSFCPRGLTMWRLTYSLVVIGIEALLLAAPVLGNAKSPSGTENPVINSEQFHERLLAIAQSYPLYGRLDANPLWAPVDCRAPVGTAHVSASKDTGTHGQKLYSLFVKQPDVYLDLAKQSPVGQVIIKESWVPELVKDPAKAPQAVVSRTLKVRTEDGKSVKEVRDHFPPYAQQDGKLYHAARQGDLFIMYKLDPATSDTDQGWVYGTVTVEGRKVTSAGRVASCMGCHQQAGKDRLFGLKAWAGARK